MQGERAAISEPGDHEATSIEFIVAQLLFDGLLKIPRRAIKLGAAVASGVKLLDSVEGDEGRRRYRLGPTRGKMVQSCGAAAEIMQQYDQRFGRSLDDRIKTESARELLPSHALLQ